MRTFLAARAKAGLYRAFLYCIRKAAKDISLYQQLEALRDSAAFARSHLTRSRAFRDRWELMDFALSQVRVTGAYLEFGVFRGESLNYIAGKVPHARVHGFDSFDGLPEDWRPEYPRGVFQLSNPGALRFAGNVEIHRGWFSDTLPSFAQTLQEDIAFLHVDSDLYSSAVEIFTLLAGRLVSGTVILFDEYYNHPGWRDDEHKAFLEFAQRTGKSFQYIGHNVASEQVAVVLN